MTRLAKLIYAKGIIQIFLHTFTRFFQECHAIVKGEKSGKKPAWPSKINGRVKRKGILHHGSIPVISLEMQEKKLFAGA